MIQSPYIIVLLAPFFLCWGSFLNVLGYRLVHNKDVIFSRSSCPLCKVKIVWYDLIPLLSWLYLRGKCRSCTKEISWLYPFIEVFTAITLSALFYLVPIIYIPAYFLFFSALIVTIRSDLESMLISQVVTVWLIPFGLILSAIDLLPISLTESMIGSILGYFILYTIGFCYKKYSGIDGIGAGDLDLLSFIGAFTGPIGCWASLFLGSIGGSIVGIYKIIKGESLRTSKLPFGPFLAFGAIAFTLFKKDLLQFLIGI